LAVVFGSALLTAALVISIVLLAKDDTKGGLCILLAALIGAPLTMVMLFFLSNFIVAAIFSSSIPALQTNPYFR
jgi:hypothetical protein